MDCRQERNDTAKEQSRRKKRHTRALPHGSGADQIKNAARIVKDNLSVKPVVVVSAIAGVTNSLVEIANQNNVTARTQRFESIRAKHEEIVEQLGLEPSLLDETFDELESLCKSKKTVTKKLLDTFVSFGERLSAPIVAGALQKMGVAAQAFPAWDLGMVVDEQFGGAEPLATTPAMLAKNSRNGGPAFDG